MEIASVRETLSFNNNTKAISPYTLRQVLQSYATVERVKELISEASIGGGGEIDLSEYAKKTDLPTRLGQLTNDVDYIQAINGIIPAKYLPSYVDEVLEYANKNSFPSPGEAGKIYVDLSTNLTYRWGSSDYVEISKSLALGTTSNTAFRGDYGLLAYEHISKTGNIHNLSLADLNITIDSNTINNLQGLDENILTSLAKKLDLSGGTLTGRLILHADPADKMHATTKQYVDNAIDGVSVTVTQNVTRISEIIDEQTKVGQQLTTQAETITEVQNELTGLNQITTDHTTLISKVEQGMDGLTTEVEKTSTTVTELQATINLLEIDFPFNAITIPVDKDNKPINDYAASLPYEVFFKGVEVSTDYTVSINGSAQGIEITNDTDKILVKVFSNTVIPNAQNNITVTWEYIQSVPYKVTRAISITTVPRGEDGSPGNPGESSYVHIKYGVETELTDASGNIIKELTFTPEVIEETTLDDGTVITNKVEAGDTPGPYIGQMTSSDPTPSTNFNDYKWFKITEDLEGSISELNQKIENQNITIQNNKDAIEKNLADNFATIQSVTTATDKISTLERENELRIEAIKKLSKDGVSKIDTGTGYVLDYRGLTIEEVDGDGNKLTGEGITKTLLTTKGMTVYSLESAEAKAILTVTSREVRMPKAIVEEGIQIGTSWVLEEFEDELHGGIAIGFFNM